MVVSLSWMTAVSLVPAHSALTWTARSNDSVYAQVFDYNGIAHLGSGNGASAGPPAPFLLQTARSGAALNSYSAQIGRSWHRLLSGLFGRDDGWLLPAALLAAAGVLWNAGAAAGATRCKRLCCCGARGWGCSA